ncbi:hypothetical protein BKA65DRAFT_594371 [Rhexocercosporidium sp. MPI-PUGE-AT-0058]|nr:hypothetical protein BKA65DRAFT_594371 [Rhexocercosporidium sp. MPI-PUGE-AT-0058]
MATAWTSICIAQVIGLGGAAWLSGNIASLSLITIPTLLNSQTQSQSQSQSTPLSSRTLALQWRHTYELGKAQNRPISAVIASSFAYLAFKSRTGGPRNVVAMYGLAALLTVGIAPFTVLVMRGVNESLIGLSEGDGKDREGEDEVRGLLERWARLNGVRSLLPFVGGVVGAFAVLT